MLCVQDITEIISNCAKQHWADRKEGLVGLQAYFQNGNALTGSELKRVTEIFTKMFMDSQTKVSIYIYILARLFVNKILPNHNFFQKIISNQVIIVRIKPRKPRKMK